MAYSEQVVSFVDGITEDGALNVKTVTRVLKDGVSIAETVHRVAMMPGDPLLDSQTKKVKDLAAVVWTPEVVAAHTAKMAKQAAEEALALAVAKKV